MNTNLDSARSLIQARGLRFADFWFTELSGRPWRITIPSEAVSETLFSAGLPLDGQPVGGSWDGVMILLVDAVYADPTASAPTLAMVCDVLDTATRRPLALEPRHVLKSAERLLEARLGATLAVGVEPEFFLLDVAARPAPESVVWDFLRQFGLALEQAGIRVPFFRTGPSIGQGRVQMSAGPALAMADRVMLYRQTAVNLARARSLRVSFMPRPMAGPGAAGMPVHQALWQGKVNLFHDDSGWAKTSQLCRWYAAGLLEHLPALLALCAPSCNSYRRLVPGVSGPTDQVLSTTLRSAACRIPARSGEPGARRVKFCPGDATANPYLYLAALIMAGLDGIDRKLEPAIEESRAARPLPHCLESALEALDRDRAFLTQADVFSDELIDAWIKDRWKQQVLPVRQAPHPMELELGNPAA